MGILISISISYLNSFLSRLRNPFSTHVGSHRRRAPMVHLPFAASSSVALLQLTTMPL